MSSERPLASGFYFKRPPEGAPSFVKGKLSIKVEDALPLLEQHRKSDGWVNMELLQSKDGTKLYLVVDQWEPNKGVESDEGAVL